MNLATIIKDSEYSLSLFPDEYIKELESKIIDKNGKAYILCQIRNKEIKLTPEEVVRQLYLMVLMRVKDYPNYRIQLEYEVSFGREKKRADIVVTDKDNHNVPYIIVELKKPKLRDGKEQLKGYCNATGAPIGVWTNGQQISYYHRKDPNYFEDISDIPNAHQKLSDIIGEKWTYEDLKKHDKLVNERKSLKDLILEMEDEVLANAGVDVFEEVFKLIFMKLYDEKESGRKPNRNLEFRNYGETEFELKKRLQNLFDKAKDKHPGIFADDEKIQLTPSHLSVCVSSLQNVKLFNSNLEVVDEAFEYLINKSSKGEKGQYFTPRYVIDMCVRMLNPQENETMIDTASGSCGFPVHTMFHVWRKIMDDLGIPLSEQYTIDKKPDECEDYVKGHVFAIDFDEKAVRVARTLNSIAGDGKTNVLYMNTLDYERWEDNLANPDWMETYSQGWFKLMKQRASRDNYRDFNFDIVMANPPFAGDIKESRILAKYEIARSVGYDKLKELPQGAKYETCDGDAPNFAEVLRNGGETIYQMADGTFRKTKLKEAPKMSRDVLFIERNLDFLRPGGRMAIVLPQGRFNNASDRYIREYIADRCRILAVVGLHGNVFKPHTGTKTSVLFVQKWDDEKCPRVDDYNIFFATMKEPSKDNRGDKIYREKINEDGTSEPLLDSHGHLIVKHDLFNHEGMTEDGIAEAFAEFAKKEHLSFFADAPLTK